MHDCFGSVLCKTLSLDWEIGWLYTIYVIIQPVYVFACLKQIRSVRYNR